MPDALQTPVLFRWPPTAAVGRVVPKTKFYEHGHIRAAMRGKFVDDVQRVTWAYKIADDTVRLRGTIAVPEIEVFTIEAKGADVSDEVLAAIDQTVHHPIIFEVTTPERVRMAAAPKTLGGRTPHIATYFTTDWQAANAPRGPLPTALDLARLYEALLASLLPVSARIGETVSEATDRLGRARKLQRAIAALETRLRNEPQPNRKLALRRELKDRQADLANML